VLAGTPSLEGVAVTGPWATELLDLAMQGDIKELVHRAHLAVTGDPSGALVYHEIERLAGKFDFKGIRRVLQDALRQTA
jgi:hypothetical protein